MSCKIVIPSHKRADRVLSKNLLCNPILCVEESQFEEYKLYNPECEIVCHPDTVIGLVAKRNWMVNHFGELFMVDDDVNYFTRKYIREGVSPVIKDPEEITRIIFTLHDMAKMIGVSLFGFTKNPNPIQYKEFEPLSLSNMITGCAYGVIKSPNTVWNEELKLKEDFWISCYVKYKERMILVDRRYNFTQKDTFINPGGLSSIRNEKTEMENILAIKKYFGDTISIKKGTHLAKSFKKNNISCTFKF